MWLESCQSLLSSDENPASSTPHQESIGKIIWHKEICGISRAIVVMFSLVWAESSPAMKSGKR